MGRSMTNVVNNLQLKGPYADAMRSLGYEMETVADTERDASLGNGGLGRLAACFLDSIANLDLPGWGYGIRYKYGMFKQVSMVELLELQCIQDKFSRAGLQTYVWVSLPSAGLEHMIRSEVCHANHDQAQAVCMVSVC